MRRPRWWSPRRRTSARAEGDGTHQEHAAGHGADAGVGRDGPRSAFRRLELAIFAYNSTIRFLSGNLYPCDRGRVCVPFLFIRALR